jgi:hypothetical protein
MPIEPQQEEHYIQMASDNPSMLCSEAPVEILEAASYAGDEPTPFLTSFFTAGHTQWLAQRYGQRVSAFEEERIERAVILLWIRACELYTSRVYGRPDLEWDKPFFSDEGLY